MIKFITSSHAKFKEMQVFVSDLKMTEMDLPEIQEIDSKRVIEAKLLEARKKVKGKVVVEDTSLLIDGMNGLPGPLVKWFTKTLGEEGMYKLAVTSGTTEAIATVVIGFIDDDGSVMYFDGAVNGNLVAPRGSNGFGWDVIFQPRGSTKTFAEMSQEQKDDFSMRAIAARKLSNFLSSQ